MPLWTQRRALLFGIFEAGIVTLTFCAKRVDVLKTETVPVNRKPVIVRNGLVFGATPVFPAVVPIFVDARAFTGFGVSEGAAVFLLQAAFTSRLSVFKHSETGITDRIAGSKGRCMLGVSLVQRDDRIAVVGISDRVVNVLCVIPLVADESVFI